MSHKLKRLQILFRAFPTRLALSLALSEATRVLLDPNRFISYSQFGEDRLIMGLFDLNQPGFYVDVGCNDPLQFSNTLALYLHGWTGLCIDGNEQLISKWKTTRLRDDAVCAVISEKPEELIFEVNDCSLLSRIVDANEPSNTKKVCVRGQTLESILHQHKVPRAFQLLSVDCEGSDLQVLRSFDIAVYKPKVVVIELVGHGYNDWSANPITAYLNKNGYLLTGLAGYSGVFVPV